MIQFIAAEFMCKLFASKSSVISPVLMSVTRIVTSLKGICYLCIYKKDDNIDCSNYRGMLLLPATYKILSNILPSGLTPYVDEITGNINVYINIIDQLLIRYSAFVKYCRKCLDP
jgi:hypothetical protein